MGCRLCWEKFENSQAVLVVVAKLLNKTRYCIFFICCCVSAAGCLGSIFLPAVVRFIYVLAGCGPLQCVVLLAVVRFSVSSGSGPLEFTVLLAIIRFSLRSCWQWSTSVYGLAGSCPLQFKVLLAVVHFSLRSCWQWST